MAFHYLVFNKPYGVLSQFTDEGTGNPTLKQYIPVPGVYAAGRLDRDSEGLLLLTNDGALIKRLTDPRFHIEKTYWAQVEGTPAKSALEQLEKGVKIKAYQTLPARARLIADPGLPPRSKPITPHGPVSWLEIILREGKKRQVRHMTAAVGLFTLRLVRVAIGRYFIGDLREGTYKELSPNELQSLLIV